jgi:alpha-L-fucosidase 2
LHEPFLQMVKDLSVTGQKTAKDMYGARGWMAHHNTDIWRATGAIDGAFWGMWTAGGGWVSQHLWEHYLYTGDKAFLTSVYPALKGAAMFYVDFLVEHPKYKWMVVNPGNSPENAPAAHDGSSLDAGVTMDNQIVFDVFNTAIRAAEMLKKDASLVNTTNCKSGWMILTTPKIITAIFHICTVYFLPIKYRLIARLSFLRLQKIH